MELTEGLRLIWESKQSRIVERIVQYAFHDRTPCPRVKRRWVLYDFPLSAAVSHCSFSYWVCCGINMSGKT